MAVSGEEENTNLIGEELLGTELAQIANYGQESLSPGLLLKLVGQLLGVPAGRAIVDIDKAVDLFVHSIILRTLRFLFISRLINV